MTTTPTSGAADLPEALRSIQRFEVVDCIDDKHVPAVIPNPHGPWVRYEDHIAALAAEQATSEKQGARAALSESFLEIPDVQDESGINAYYSREVVLECIDAALASHGQAPAGAWIERWHGSGGKDGYEGWSIVNKDDRAMVAYLGRGVYSEAVTKIVMAHNATRAASHGQAPAQPDPAYSAACHLATALFKKYFAHLPDFASGQAVWGLCGSTAGVISQIDNMVSGLLQPPTTAFSEDEL